MSELEQLLEGHLEQLAGRGRMRRMRMVSGPQGPTVLLDGVPVLLLCSNNYLGLADHPQVRQAAADAAMRWGVGAGASRLISGTMTVHRRLEERLAAFHQSGACVLFGSGYLANLGVLGALAGRGASVFSDELNHASIVDACRLSRAEVVVYRHRDIEHLHWSLQRHGGLRARGRERLIVTDSVFSMDGDLAPLPELVELARGYDARLLVDEAHAIGSLGPGGRGAVAEAGLEEEVDVIVGTLGKALGSYGAYACATETTVRYLVNASRPLIFSTAPAPPVVAGALAALDVLETDPQRVHRLRANARILRGALAQEGFPVPDSEMHIIPLLAGEERDALALCERALTEGVFAQAIRPPTVPEGTSRLRLTALASHRGSELRRAAGVLARAARELGLDPRQMGAAHEERWVSAPPGRVVETVYPGGGLRTESEADGSVPEIAGGDVIERSAHHGEATPFDLDEEVGGAPFDLERGAGGAPFGSEQGAGGAPFDLQRDADGAPFDLERDAAPPARAA